MIRCQKEGKDILELPEYIQNMYQKWKESCREAIISSKQLLLSQIRLIIVSEQLTLAAFVQMSKNEITKMCNGKKTELVFFLGFKI